RHRVRLRPILAFWIVRRGVSPNEPLESHRSGRSFMLDRLVSVIEHLTNWGEAIWIIRRLRSAAVHRSRRVPEAHGSRSRTRRGDGDAGAQMTAELRPVFVTAARVALAGGLIPLVLAVPTRAAAVSDP